ncbi:MAG: Uma2 family endonuclease [Isosphaeraceae bacterium]|nr:Uma2 family endonuclease [Isosphaeraceae bacterium]
MATIVEPHAATQTDAARFLFHDVSWDDYEALLRIVGNRPVRVTYDQGALEMMVLSYDHERFGNLLGRMIEMMTVELNIPCEGAGSTTWRKKASERGLEADECYYVANAERVEGRTIDLSVDPSPDLAIEVELTTSVLDRIGVYAALGIPEIWRYDGKALRVECLTADGTYSPSPTSASFPFLPIKDVERWLHLAGGMGQTLWARQFLRWVRETLLPVYDAWRAANESRCMASADDDLRGT